MKKFCFIFFAFAAFAQEQEFSYWDVHPIHAGGNAILIGHADVEYKDGTKAGDLLFNKENVFLYGFLPISKLSFLMPRVEWNTFEMNWDQNPKFNDTRFEFVQFALTFMTLALEKWRWIMRADANFDMDHFTQYSDYGLFSGLLWGAYELHPKWHYHVGALGYLGLDGEIVYPVIGIDWSPNKRWTFQAIFPMIYSIERNFTPEWKLSLKIRPLKERFRVGNDQPQPQSVFCYSTMGAEMNLRYEKFLRCEAEIFGGYNFGGSFYIKDKNGGQAVYTTVQSAPYVGASFNWGF